VTPHVLHLKHEVTNPLDKTILGGDTSAARNCLIGRSGNFLA